MFPTCGYRFEADTLIRGDTHVHFVRVVLGFGMNLPLWMFEEVASLFVPDLDL